MNEAWRGAAKGLIMARRQQVETHAKWLALHERGPVDASEDESFRLRMAEINESIAAYRAAMDAAEAAMLSELERAVLG